MLTPSGTHRIININYHEETSVKSCTEVLARLLSTGRTSNEIPPIYLLGHILRVLDIQNKKKKGTSDALQDHPAMFSAIHNISPTQMLVNASN